MIILDNLPKTIGVYFFKKRNKILYIGKSNNIKVRIASHIENSKIDPKAFFFVNQADKIEWISTNSELEAVLLEAKLIKKFQPKYNSRWKDDKSYLYIKITINEQYPKIHLSRKSSLVDKKSIYFGPFASTKIVNNIIREIRKIIPFCTQTRITQKPCFYSKIKLCSPCPNFINNLNNNVLKKKLKKQYQENIKKVIKILQGQGEKIIRQLEKKLNQFSKKFQFEEAIEIRNRMLKLKYLLEMPLEEDQKIADDRHENSKALSSILKIIKKYFPRINKLNRIECYDASNLYRKEATASLVVLTNGLIDKSQYRKFKIKNLLVQSDSAMLAEVLKRRFNHNWPKPDLILIDGGKPQVKTIVNVLNQLKLEIPIIGMAKNPDRIVIGKYPYPTLKLVVNNPGFNRLRLLRDESHQGAKKYHLFLRDKILL